MHHDKSLSTRVKRADVAGQPQALHSSQARSETTQSLATQSLATMHFTIVDMEFPSDMPP